MKNSGTIERIRAPDALHFLAEAGPILARSLDFEETLRSLVDLAGSRLADWCLIEVLEESHWLQFAGPKHDDRTRLLESVARPYPFDPRCEYGAAEVLRTGRPMLLREVPDWLLHAVVTDKEPLGQLRTLGQRSAIIVPLAIPERILGTVTLAAERPYSDEDLAVAEHLARFAALAMHNAALHRATERKLAEHCQAEAELRASEQSLRAVLDTASVGMLQCEAATERVVRVNRKICEITGYSAEELRSMKLREVFAPEDAADYDDCYQRLVRGDYAEDVREVRFRNKSGHIGWAEVSATLVRGARGEPQYAVAVIQDVTAEREAREALRISHERLDLVVRSTQLGLWYWDWPSDKLVLSERCKQHFGLPAEAEISIEKFFDCIHPEDRRRTREAIRLSVSRREPFDLEYRTITPNGGVRWIRALGTGFYDASGRAMRFDGVTIDVTNQKRIEDALKQADRRKDEFVAMLAHELRNPLAPVRSSVEFLELISDNNPMLLATTEVIERQVQQMTRLIDDLLDVSRIAQGKIKLNVERLDLAAVVEHAVELSRWLIESRNHQLTVSLPEQPVVVQGDRARLAQIIANLLNNAAKYTEDRGRIWLTVEPREEEVFIRVRDTGIGIATEMLPTVFDLFAQVDFASQRSQGGLGIGLSLVRRLTELHGGSVQAYSGGPGQGSEFVVRLPRGCPSDQPLEETPTPQKPVAVERRARRIMIVDDNADSVDSLALLLGRLGYEVRTAHDGRSAVSAITLDPPEVVLLDIGLPDIDGYQLARKIRQQPGLQDVLLIAMTGFGQEEDRRRARAAGFDDHLTKPVSAEDLQQAIAHAAERNHHERKQ